MKIPVKIVTVVPTQGVSGGLADFRMLRQFKSEIVRVPTDLAASQVSGGVLPITQAQYDLVMA